MKTCARCGAGKSLEEFNRDKSKVDGRCSTCRECSRQRSAQWYADNTERHNEYGRRRYADDPAPTRIARDRWNARNAERKRQTDRAWYEANKERMGDFRRAWRDANRERMYASNQKRQRVINERREPVRREDTWARDNGLCQLCGEPIDRDLAYPHHGSLTLDHIVPLARGGLHEPTNVQLAHHGCNMRKGKRAS